MDTVSVGAARISRRRVVGGLLGGGAGAVAGSVLGAARHAAAAGAPPNNSTTEATYSILHATSARLLLAAHAAAPARIQLSYLGSKVGHLVPDFDDIPAVDVPAGRTAVFGVDLSNPAFAGGYGAVRARSVDITGAPSAIPFTAYSLLDSPSSVHHISDSNLVGNEFIFPLAAIPKEEASRVVLAVTVFSGRGTPGVRIRHFGGTLDTTIEVPAGATLRWDSAEHNVDVNAPGQLYIDCVVPLVVSAFIDRRGPRDAHVYLPNLVVY